MHRQQRPYRQDAPRVRAARGAVRRRARAPRNALERPPVASRDDGEKTGMKLPPRTCHLADAVFVHDGVRVDAALRGREAPREQVTDALPSHDARGDVPAEHRHRAVLRNAVVDPRDPQVLRREVPAQRPLHARALRGGRRRVIRGGE
eukprot:30621-Pelagococcus_subviridis.AAC.3